MPPTSTRTPASTDSSPILTTLCGLAFGHTLGMPAAASSRAKESGSDPQTGLERVELEDDGEEEGHREEDAGLHDVLGEEHREATDEAAVAQHDGTHERLPAGAHEVALPTHEDEDDEQAEDDQPDGR